MWLFVALTCFSLDTQPTLPPVSSLASFSASQSSTLPTTPPAPPLTPPAESAGSMLVAVGKELIQVITIQAFGYGLKVLGVVTPVTEAGIGHYVGLIGFPCVLFTAIVTLDASAPGIVAVALATLLAKSIVFGLGFALGACSTPAGDGAGAGYTRGALVGCYATNSDDVGLGYPILKILFPSHAVLCYILAAMQALILNPLAFVLLGVGAAKRHEAEGSADAPRQEKSLGVIVLQVILSLRKNMLVVAVLAGLFYRLVIGNTLPWWAAAPISLLGKPFAPLVYLIGGFAFVGSTSCVDSLQHIAMPLAVTALKSVMLPILTRTTINASDHFPCRNEVDFIFLYGVCFRSRTARGSIPHGTWFDPARHVVRSRTARGSIAQ